MIPNIPYSAKRWLEKTLVNCNVLSLSSSINTQHLHATLNLKTVMVYFIIMCSAKAVRAFVVSSVVREYHIYKDVWNAPNDRA